MNARASSIQVIARLVLANLFGIGVSNMSIHSTMRWFPGLDGFEDLLRGRNDRPQAQPAAKPSRDPRSSLASLRSLQRKKYGKKL